MYGGPGRKEKSTGPCCGQQSDVNGKNEMFHSECFIPKDSPGGLLNGCLAFF